MSDCDELSPELRAHLRQLLAFDTTSRESNLALIDAIADYFEKLGIAATRVYNQERTKANLYARLGPAGNGGVMLSGHTDVVPVDGQNWSVEPFQLTERDGKCYGRGSADMKGFLGCVLTALPTFVSANLRMPLHLAFSYDEEVGCLGVRSLIAHLNASVEKPAMCIIGEPTSMQPVYGHKGKIGMRCKIHGYACHSAYAPNGVNAIEYAAKLIGKITELAEPLKTQCDERFDPPYSTLQTGVIQGGSALNIVPQYCQFDMEMRYLPKTDASVTFSALKQYAHNSLQPLMQQVHESARVEFEPLSAYPPLLTDPQSEFASWLSQWSDSSGFGTVAFGTEGGLFDEAGITTLVCGPGSMEQGHKSDEFVTVKQLNRCMAMLDNLRQWMSAD
ncbi:acetylornithine deacetylase [Celerinatantimonas diazotrophica]|uniref:Acetylornithine deacetylase n=1 Tax=Celerinatantimonas diazotrophica TaxID=412034 RepID=A0A4R1K3X9_9GAMM|nr:acetylornithine deacetylase [Celerinatantimonas diazotrophica]TCK58610.1 acetylornithine deacetylase [Celerinatantimonas diazotrophica]CAG9297239.1 Acetylornithine deacetylase [Celerinatantimonas diazotrophica]